MPPRQAREEIAVRVGALLGGTLTLLAIRATEGLHRLHDRNRQRVVDSLMPLPRFARGRCHRILHGSVPGTVSSVIETALMGMGVG